VFQCDSEKKYKSLKCHIWLMSFDRPGIQTTVLEWEAIEMTGRSVLILADRITDTQCCIINTMTDCCLPFWALYCLMGIPTTKVLMVKAFNLCSFGEMNKSILKARTNMMQIFKTILLWATILHVQASAAK